MRRLRRAEGVARLHVVERVAEEGVAAARASPNGFKELTGRRLGQEREHIT